MERKLIATRDGSHSISIPDWDVTYHSIHGAIQESNHVFIQAGLVNAITRFPGQIIRIFEMGFGTGLNALLSMLYTTKHRTQLEYVTVEKHPIEPALALELNYCHQLGEPSLQSAFMHLHDCKAVEVLEPVAGFHFRKIHGDIQSLPPGLSGFNLVYFDAFAPTAQPELWTSEVFTSLWQRCLPGAILTTYCSKSVVRKNMELAGWKVVKLPGPPGKREMVLARRQPV